ncbi:Juvenile hormone acid O-methyltransferase [Pseudolycoriella hygida]|uniref:Juvenile hormone acid O-methyltransferase n=1 Tax=Pseudolycoriella hygida TaxID=35572 RepID=A0A9Q0MI04_9DIPT|nr:Juvenile hormone acid O-methyltransferase [Pseudolycoriella hygida]
MHNAALYANVNIFQRNAVKKVLKQFAPLLQWRKAGGDLVLDVGCGSGNTTTKILLPALPSTINRLIACDLSDEMLKYAKQYHNHPKVSYEKLDITGPIDEFLAKYGLFDHIVSFLCFNWEKKQREGFQNIFNLLKPNGDCLMMFIVTTNAFTVFTDMSKTEKWSGYMQDIAEHIPIQHYCDLANVVNDLQVMIKSIGFTRSNVEIVEATGAVGSYADYRKFYTAVNPFFERLSPTNQEDFMDEFLQRIMKMYREQKHETEFFTSTKLVVIVARK